MTSSRLSRSKYRSSSWPLTRCGSWTATTWHGQDIGKGIGYADLDGWNNYIDAVYKLGQIKTRPKTEDVVTNQFIAEANQFDKAKVKSDADGYKLRDEWKAVQVPAECR